jgi:AmiR/NasT family two-component response regulator
MVSAQRGVGLEEALALLRAYAFAQDQTLDTVAAAVVARRLRLDSDEAGEPAG